MAQDSSLPTLPCLPPQLNQTFLSPASPLCPQNRNGPRAEPESRQPQGCVQEAAEPASRLPGPRDSASRCRRRAPWHRREHGVGGGGLALWPTTKENKNAERGANSEASVPPFLLHLSHLHKQDPSLSGIRWITPVLYSGILSPFITTARRQKGQHVHTEDALWKYIALSWSHFGSRYLFLSFSNVGHFHWLHSIQIGVGGILEADTLGKCGIFSRFNSFCF